MGHAPTLPPSKKKTAVAEKSHFIHKIICGEKLVCGEKALYLQ
jgi:hypothetical protein